VDIQKAMFIGFAGDVQAWIRSTGPDGKSRVWDASTRCVGLIHWATDDEEKMPMIGFHDSGIEANLLSGIFHSTK
jgi:hypothetical protein